MKRRAFLKLAAVMSALGFVRPRVAEASPVHVFEDQEPLGFVPPSVTCWPGRGKVKPPKG